MKKATTPAALILRLRKSFVIFITALALAFSAAVIITNQIASQNAIYAQMYSVMEQIAARPVILSGAQDAGTTFPYFAVTQTPEGTLTVTGENKVRPEVLSNTSALVKEALATGTQKGSLGANQLLFYLNAPAPQTSTIVFADTQQVDSQLTFELSIKIAIGFATVVAFAVFAAWFARRLTTPILASLDAEKRFLSNAAHELKTPLTVLIANAELARDTLGATEDHAKYLANVETQAKYMRSLTTELLELARGDAPSRDAAPVVDASEVVNAACLPFEPLAFEANHPLVSHIEPGLHVRISPDALTKIANVFLDNAIKYSTLPGDIELSFARSGADAVLRVSNPATPFTASEKTQIFERFWQADEARAQQNGFGLGLAIAETLVRAARGTCEVKTNSTHNIFEVHLPLIRS